MIKQILFMMSFVMLSLFPLSANAGEQKTILALDNMTCSSCSYMVKGSLLKVDGVSEVTVSYKHKTAAIIYDDAKTTIPSLIEATTNAGFPSHEIKGESKK